MEETKQLPRTGADSLYSRHRHFLLITKLGITIASFWLLTYFVSLDTFLRYLRGANPEWLIVALVVFLSAQIVSALRCVYVVRVLGGQLTLPRSIRVHFIGLWFNQLLPSGLGGDVVKAAMLSRNLGTSVAVRATILDRASGFTFLMFSILLLLGGYQYLLDDIRITLVLAVISIGSLGTICALAAFTQWIRSAIKVPKWMDKLLLLFADMYQFRRARPLHEQVLTSLFVHVNGIVSYTLIGKSLGVGLNVSTYFLLVPLVFLVALFPISFASWGVREVGAVSIFGLVGVSAEQALAMSVLFGLLLIVAAIPGLVMFIATSRIPNK